MVKRRRRLALLAALPVAAAVMALGLPSASAQTGAGAVAMQHTGTGSYCDLGGSSSPCIENRADGNVNLGAATGQQSRLVLTVETDECASGYVDSTGGQECPFPTGSGLNSDYAGDPIVEIVSADYEWCISAPTATPVSDSDCEDNGVLWVVASATPWSGVSDSDLLINKYLTNKFYSSGDTQNEASQIMSGYLPNVGAGLVVAPDLLNNDNAWWTAFDNGDGPLLP